MKFKPVVTNSIRAQVGYPRPPHVLGREIIIISEQSVIETAESYRYEEDIFVNGQYLAKRGDVWWRVREVDGQEISGWTPEKHLGETLLTELAI